jgi:hypothetical protein
VHDRPFPVGVPAPLPVPFQLPVPSHGQHFGIQAVQNSIIQPAQFPINRPIHQRPVRVMPAQPIHPSQTSPIAQGPSHQLPIPSTLHYTSALYPSRTPVPIRSSMAQDAYYPSPIPPMNPNVRELFSS